MNSDAVIMVATAPIGNSRNFLSTTAIVSAKSPKFGQFEIVTAEFWELHKAVLRLKRWELLESQFGGT